MKEIVSGIMLTLLLIGMLMSGFNFAIAGFYATESVESVEPANGFGTQSSVDWWSMFRHDLRHTGYSTSKAPRTNNTIWIFQTGDVVYSSPAVADCKVFVGSIDHNVYALNVKTGALVWNYTTGDWVTSSPAVWNGILYISSWDGNLYALNATTGTKLWNCTTGGGSSSPAVADGIVYIGSRDYNVYALNATTGTKIWNYTTGSKYIQSSPAVADGKVFIGSWDHNLYTLNATNGALIWNYTTGDRIYSSPTVVEDMVYFSSLDGHIYALNATTGNQIWNYTTGVTEVASPAVAYGAIFISSDDYNIYAFNATTGALIWKYLTGNSSMVSPAIADGKVFTGSNDGKVYALNATTGTLIWTYQTNIGGWGFSSSPAVADGMVFVGSGDGKVYTFGPPKIVINEVMFDPFGDDGGNEWIELYNGGSEAQNISNWVISNRTGKASAILPNWIFPNGTYLVVHFGNGTNDNDFSDGQGHYYTGVNMEAFNNTMDEAALYGGTLTPEQWETFWSMGDVNRDGFIDQTDLELIADAFGSYEGHPKWNPDADLNKDGIVNSRDVEICGNNQGLDIQTYFIIGASTIIDFISWSLDIKYSPGAAHDYAVAACIWDYGDFFSITFPPAKLGYIMVEGDTIGRDSNSTDTNEPDDWTGHCGKDAWGPTQGKRNFHMLTFTLETPQPQPKKNWTVIVYMVSDGTFGDGSPMDWAAIEDINEMEKGKVNETNMNVIVQVDFLREAGGNTLRYYIKHDDTPDFRTSPKSPVWESLGEVNMGNPATLESFVTWAMNVTPADRYALIIWGHGAGWKGVGFDETDSDHLTMAELKGALSNTKNIAGKNMELVGFMSCLMGMTEVAYQIAGSTDVMVASEEVIYIPGWDFENITGHLESNPSWNQTDLGKDIVTIYGSKLRRATDTLSVIDLREIGPLINAISTFADKLKNGTEDYGREFTVHNVIEDNVQRKIRNHLNASEKFGDKNFIDLYDFTSRIKADADIVDKWKDAGGADQIIQLLSTTLIVIKEVHGPKHAGVRGLSIYFPTAQKESNYLYEGKPYNNPWPSPNRYHEDPQFDFPTTTKWDEFLLRYYGPVADAGEDVDTVGMEVLFKGIGSSDSDSTIFDNSKLLAKYSWNFGDGNTYTEIWNQTAPDGKFDGKTTHVFSAIGEYIVILTVEDHEGKIDQDDAKVTVWPQPQIYTLRIDVEKPVMGTTDPTPGNHTYGVGTEVNVTAIPNLGYRFGHWILNGSNAGTANPITITMDTNHNLTAVFQASLTLTATGCGEIYPPPGVYWYDANTNVTVTAIPSFKFGYWVLDDINIGAVNPVTITLDRNHMLKAIFCVKLTITTTWGGTTTPTPGEYYPYFGSTWVALATPYPGYVFDHWELYYNGEKMETKDNPIEFELGARCQYLLHAVFVGSVGGIVIPVDKFGLLAPYIGLASTILVAVGATVIYVKRVKQRKEKQ